jgi:hypothetical protein
MIPLDGLDPVQVPLAQYMLLHPRLVVVNERKVVGGVGIGVGWGYSTTMFTQGSHGTSWSMPLRH